MAQKKENVTVQDIAKILNISPSTVSRSLNNHEKISIQTREKVWKTARKLGYKPNIPVYMKPKKTKTICLIIPDVKTDFISDITTGVQNYATSENFNLFIACSQNSIKEEKNIINNLTKLNFQGVIITANDKHDKSTHLHDLLEQNTPMVLINNFEQEISSSNVIPDIYQGVSQAINHLASMGCKKTALLTCIENNPSRSTMQEAYKSITDSMNMETLDLMVDISDMKSEEIISVIEEMKHKSNIPVGIITCNNTLALQIIYYLKNAGINVPGDVLVIGFGNDTFGSFVSPTITSVQYSGYNIGKSAAKLLFNEIKTGENIQKTIIEPVKLVIKGSSIRMNK